MIQFNKIFICLLIACLRFFIAPAQSFRYSAELDTVSKTGFYRIDILPELSAHIDTGLEDIRIAGKNDRWVPHILQRTGTSPENHSASPLYLDNPVPNFLQKDSNGYSYIEVMQKAAYQFDRVSLSVSGSKFYNRDVTLYLAKNNHPLLTGSMLGNFKLSSAMPAVFDLPRTRAIAFFVVIRNGDNPPLKIEGVTILQQRKSLVAYLEQGQNYKLLFGDSLAVAPNYDLQTFKDSITAIQVLRYGKIQAKQEPEIAENQPRKQLWIWPVIILAGIVLSFLTYRLSADIHKSKR